MRPFALAAVLLLAGCGKPDAPVAAPPPASVPDDPVKSSAPQVKEPTREAVVQAMFDAAAKIGTLAAYHEVAVRVPETGPGRKALEQCAGLEGAEHAALEQKFVPIEREVADLAKRGRFKDAIDRLVEFERGQDSLRRKALRKGEELRNEARIAYMAALKAARTAPLDDAAAMLKTASEHSTTEVREAAERDLTHIERVRVARDAKRAAAEEAESVRILDERSTVWLKRIRERAYAEVLKEMEAALADPKLAPSKERLAADRDAVNSAAAFWDALQGTLKAHLNQEVAWRTADNKLIRGTLKRVTDSSVKIENLDVPLASLHVDQLVLLAIHRKALPEDAGPSYGSAAMWFFLEGKHDLSRLFLATSVELASAAESLEVSWRRGFLRQAVGR